MFELQMAKSPLELTSGMQCPLEKKIKGKVPCNFFFFLVSWARQLRLAFLPLHGSEQE